MSASPVKKGRILAGWIVLCAAAVLIQEGLNLRLRFELASLARQREAVAAKLKSDQRLGQALSARLANLQSLDAYEQLPQADRFTGFPGSATFRGLVLRVRGEVAADYGALFRRMRLNPDQQAKFEKLLLEKNATAVRMANLYGSGGLPGVDPNNLEALKALTTVATKDLDDEMRQVAGDGPFNQYQQYADTLRYRIQVDDFVTQFSHTNAPISDDQADQLTALLAQADTDPAQPLPDTFANQAAAILGPSQGRALKSLEETVQARRAILAMNTAAINSGQLQVQRASGVSVILKY